MSPLADENVLKDDGVFFYFLYILDTNNRKLT